VGSVPAGLIRISGVRIDERRSDPKHRFQLILKKSEQPLDIVFGMPRVASILCLAAVSLLGTFSSAQQAPPQDDKILERGDSLLEEAKSAYEEARTKSSVPGFVEAGFKLEEARIKFIVLQEIGPLRLFERNWRQDHPESPAHLKRGRTKGHERSCSKGGRA